MKVAQTDSDAVAAPAAPAETRRASGALSLLVTAAVVIGSVVAVYSIFPNRWLRITERAIEAHREASPAYELATPTRDQLVAWSVGVLGRPAPWPELGPSTQIVGARSIEVPGGRAAHAVYDVDGIIVSIVARLSDDDGCRRVDGGDVAITWRDGPWTLVAVGPKATEARWASALGIR